MQKLLKEEGYKDAKLLFICICRNEKEQTRNGKTIKKFVYNGKFSVLENKDDLCIHCGKKGYLKYYYLGIGTKVKNWFKNVDMCRKCCPIGMHMIIGLAAKAAIQKKSEFWDGE